MVKRRRDSDVAAPVRRWRSPRRRSALTDSALYSILPTVLGTGTGRDALTACRATCRSIRDALGGGLARLRLEESRAQIARCLPVAGSLARASARVAENGHLQLDGEFADVASLLGTWDQYVVGPLNWRAPWPASRGRELELRGNAFEDLRRRLATPYGGIAAVEGAGRQLYVDEGAAVRLAFDFPERAPGVVVACVESQPIQDTFNVSVPERIFGFFSL